MRLNPERVAHHSLGSPGYGAPQVNELQLLLLLLQLQRRTPTGFHNLQDVRCCHCETLSGFETIDCHQPGVRCYASTPGFVVQRRLALLILSDGLLIEWPYIGESCLEVIVSPV